MLSHPLLGTERLPAGRAVHTVHHTAPGIKSELSELKVKLVAAHFRLDIYESADVVFGVETVGTLRFAVDDGVETLGDGLVDNALKGLGLGTELLDFQDFDEEALDDTVVLQGVTGLGDAFVGEIDALVLL